ncbi:MAG: hypothetical protein ACKVOK_12780 [Flavobacteriales bacterium]
MKLFLLNFYLVVDTKSEANTISDCSNLEQVGATTTGFNQAH